MRFFLLDKVVLRITNNAEKFLNGLTSNSLNKPRNAFLTQHGRIIATFDQVKSGADEFLIVMERFAYEPLMQHAKKFLMLNKTMAEPACLQAFFDLGGDYQAGSGEYTIPQRSGQIILTPNALQANVLADEFTQFRLLFNIPVHGTDYKDELLLNIDEYEYVSYTKGCFLGQEPIAKVHNRSRPTWKLVVRSEDELTSEEQLKMTSKMIRPENGKAYGFVFVKNAA